MSDDTSSATTLLATVYAGVDDIQWVSAASPGLLRRGRKDLGAAIPTLVSASATEAVVDVAGHTVTLAAEGPAKSRCTCPSVEICRHIVSAGLWLGTLAPTPAPDAVPPPGAAPLDTEPPAKPAAARAGRKPVGQKPGHRTRARAELLPRVRALLLDTVELGSAHVSPTVVSRYRAAAISAQTADHFRLATALRRIGDHCAQIVARSAGAGESHVAADLSTTLALVTVLAVAGDQAPTRLLGVGRGTYALGGDLTVIGLGAYPWRTASGYQGLTAVLYWPAGSRCLTVSHARPAHVESFDPVSIYRRREPVWPGLSSMSAATGARILLRDAQIGQHDRLSRSETTTATVAEVSAAVRSELGPVSDWSRLHTGAAGRSLLDPVDLDDRWIIVAPKNFGEPRFDDVAQVLRWPLFDGNGASIVASLHYSDLTDHAIRRVRTIGRPAPGTLVVGRLVDDDEGTALAPISLVPPADFADPRPVDSLYFDDRPPTDSAPGTPHQHRPPSDRPPQSALNALQGELIRIIERGISGRDTQVRTEVSTRIRALRDLGFSVFVEPTATAPTTAELVLRTYAVAEQLRLLGA